MAFRLQGCVIVPWLWWESCVTLVVAEHLLLQMVFAAAGDTEEAVAGDQPSWISPQVFAAPGGPRALVGSLRETFVTSTWSLLTFLSSKSMLGLAYR